MVIKLYWTKVSLSVLREVNSHLYAFGGFDTPYYIGKSFDTDVSPELRQNLKAFNVDPRGLQIWIGQLEDNGEFERVSGKLIRDIENLLIYRYQPPYNTQHKRSYTGRYPLVVVSRGSHPFSHPVIEA